MKEPKLSILFVGTQMAVGGAQKVLLDQARWFSSRGHRVLVVFFYDKEYLHQKWQDASEFPVINLNAFRKNATLLRNFLFLLGGLFRFFRLLQQYKFEVVESFTHDSNTLALPFAWLAGVPVRIATHHGALDDFPKWREKLHTLIVNSGITTVLVAVSEKMRQKAIREGVSSGKITVIQNGVEPITIEGLNKSEIRQQLGVDNDDLFLVSVGRLVYPKAHEVLVSAMPIVLKEFPSAKLGICGDGVLRPDLEKQIVELGLSERIKLFGMMDSIMKILAVTDVFVLPSRREGLPIALLEAMSVALPVVAARAEGLDEVVVDRVDGLLVPVEDANALAHAILQLLRDPQMRKRLGSASREKLLKLYSIDHMANKYLSLMIEKEKNYP